jgi:hypothetical protein
LLTIRRDLVRQNGKTVIKDTETHQMRIVNLDPDRRDPDRPQTARRTTARGKWTTLTDDTFVFLIRRLAQPRNFPEQLVSYTRRYLAVGGARGGDVFHFTQKQHRRRQLAASLSPPQ